MKTKRSALNFVSDVIPLLIISILGIFKLKLFIQILGDETLGLYQLFSQIMVYVALVDGGLTSAVLYSLYKPNANNDENKMSEILSAAKKAFSFIGMIVFFVAFVVSFFIQYFIKDFSFNIWYIRLLFMLFSLSNVVSYFFVPYQVLLEVKEKKYLVNICLQTGQILLSVLEIIMLLNGMSFIKILIMHAIVKLISNIAVYFFCKKNVDNVTFTSQDKDYSFKNNIKHLLVHKVNGLIGSNIDIVIISSFLGLEYVAIYSVYNYIINMIKTIVGKLSSSIVAIIGNKNAENVEEGYKVYQEMNSLLFFVAIIICVPLVLAINSFIDIWYEGTINTSLLIAVSFVSLLYVFIIKLSSTTFVTSAGLFKETEKCAFLDMSINLVLSLILVNYLGIAGVILATTFSTFISEYMLKTIVLFKNNFKKEAKYFFLNNIKYFILTMVALFIGYIVISNIIIPTILNWFLIFVIYTLLNTFLVLGCFYLFKDLNFLKRIKYLLRRA